MGEITIGRSEMNFWTKALITVGMATGFYKADAQWQGTPVTEGTGDKIEASVQTVKSALDAAARDGLEMDEETKIVDLAKSLGLKVNTRQLERVLHDGMDSYYLGVTTPEGKEYQISTLTDDGLENLKLFNMGAAISAELKAGGGELGADAMERLNQLAQQEGRVLSNVSVVGDSLSFNYGIEADTYQGISISNHNGFEKLDTADLLKNNTPIKRVLNKTYDDQVFDKTSDAIHHLNEQAKEIHGEDALYSTEAAAVRAGDYLTKNGISKESLEVANKLLKDSGAKLQETKDGFQITTDVIVLKMNVEKGVGGIGG